MECPKCGARVFETDLTCLSCGAPLLPQAVALAGTDVQGACAFCGGVALDDNDGVLVTLRRGGVEDQTVVPRCRRCVEAHFRAAQVQLVCQIAFAVLMGIAGFMGGLLVGFFSGLMLGVLASWFVVLPVQHAVCLCLRTKPLSAARSYPYIKRALGSGWSCEIEQP